MHAVRIPRGLWRESLHARGAQGFLTAMKQEVNRKHAADRWALDDVVMTAEVLHPPRDADALREPPSEGVYIYGLFLDGCAWSAKEGRLVDSEPKKLFCPLPVLHVTGVQARAPGSHPPPATISQAAIIHHVTAARGPCMQQTGRRGSCGGSPPDAAHAARARARRPRTARSWACTRRPRTA